MKNVSTIPTYTYGDTSDEGIKRFLDRENNWTHYFLVKEKKFVKAVNHVLALGYSKGPRFAQYLLNTTKEEAAKKLTAAGDEGTRTHRAINDLIKGIRVTMDSKYPSEVNAGRQEPLNDDEWDNLIAFERWCKEYNPRAIAIEQTVAGEDYAGTFDALMVLTVPAGDKVFSKDLRGKDVLVLIDWKSSSGIWNEYASQVAAYWWAIRSADKYAQFRKQYHGRIFTAVVRLGTKHKCGYEMEAWDEGVTCSDNMSLFRSAGAIADRHQPEFTPEIEHIPTQIHIKIEKLKVEKAIKGRKVKKAAAKKTEDVPQIDNTQSI